MKFKKQNKLKRFFFNIGIISFVKEKKKFLIYKKIYKWLLKKKYNVITEKKMNKKFSFNFSKSCNIKKIAKKSDLVIILGGDGSMLKSCRILAKYNVKVIGLNLGNLGFLTDLETKNLKKKLKLILKGNFVSDKRFLLETKIVDKKKKIISKNAINEIIIHANKFFEMINFSVYIDEVFAFSCKSDGLVISTPTGSTAYSLSIGGPIIHPSLNAILISPIFPHSLSFRPIIIDNQKIIKIKIKNINLKLNIRHDNQDILFIKEGKEILINRTKYYLDLIHINNYNHFNKLKKIGFSL
ncbi:MAG: NAD(+)/NADH kinase [Enterobacteriaceae bacterium]